MGNGWNERHTNANNRRGNRRPHTHGDGAQHEAGIIHNFLYDAANVRSVASVACVGMDATPLPYWQYCQSFKKRVNRLNSCSYFALFLLTTSVSKWRYSCTGYDRTHVSC